MFISTLKLNSDERVMLEKQISRDVIHRQISGLSEKELALVEAVFSYGYDLSSDVIEKMSSLKWIHIGQSGMEKLPFDLINNRGIVVTNSRGINASNIGEHVICTLLNHERKSYVYHEAQKNHYWDDVTRMGELRDSTLGVLGLGMAGREIVKRAIGFDMRILGMDMMDVSLPGVEKVYKPSELPSMLKECDYIVISLPLTKDTYHLLDEKAFESVKDGVFIINCARGGILDIEALKNAIEAKKVCGASLDVFDVEPLPSSSELWEWNREKLEITPHIAGDHFVAYAKRMIELMASNINIYPDFNSMRNKVNLK